eukprot:365946-Chlamydomonas_euryale.AAC.1
MRCHSRPDASAGGAAIGPLPPSPPGEAAAAAAATATADVRLVRGCIATGGSVRGLQRQRRACMWTRCWLVRSGA